MILPCGAYRDSHSGLLHRISEEVLVFAGANAVLATMQQILTDAAESGGARAQVTQRDRSPGLCLVALAFASELSISKDPAGMAAMASRLAESLSDVMMKV